MTIVLSGNTRTQLELYMQRQAQLSGVTVSNLTKRYSVDPSVQQRLENAAKESTELTQKINVIGVDDQEGDKVLVDTTGPIARTNSSSDGVKRRNPVSPHELAARRYRCEQVNYDTFISYSQLDAWSAHADFQARVSQQIARQIALDRIMIGFNGTSHALISDFAANPLLQDVNTGWMEQIRKHAAARVMSDVTISTRDMDNKVTAKGQYGNPDALVQDVRSSLLDEWHKDAPDLVVLMGRDLFNTLRLPLINAMSTTNPNTELMAGQLIISSRFIGGLPVYLAPFFPKDAMLITSFSNLSIYFQKGSLRRLMKEEPEYNRIATYQSMNDAYVVEDYGKSALIQGIKFADAPAEGGGA
ncbi:phage major capsid protein, P2 family [Citrobacter youngae]|uniref:phage major capsid protein, P2 family n=1 Tax=Citrobacter TaxID=544 RepID=UPI001900208F|nr:MULTISPECIES: phage major capsid protein, P2 family [Citrobacter]MBJ9109979.1 phage major capsid protein, P2 family [Citrobacter sp. FDAARGOS_156]MBJ9156763.1 phage major capsid protein, P2 family [Citrobacter sp. FDAARGOS_156]MBJ9202172.1 phage major capsid protein, P2 family [Citrobacter sp. FDAARGOS_156]MBK6259089.1 phage major capsid protein, P2 family [Citrobacter youngae]MDM2924400.1 phage major capsid protein, P2 family [Citrobacter sp. Cpa228]